MVEQEARDTAEAFRHDAEIPAGCRLEWVEKRYIEISKPRQDGKVFVRDFLAWIAHFTLGIAWWELAVDDTTGKLLRTERSR
jgi:hypothetical protein